VDGVGEEVDVGEAELVALDEAVGERVLLLEGDCIAVEDVVTDADGDALLEGDVSALCEADGDALLDEDASALCEAEADAEGKEERVDVRVGGITYEGSLVLVAVILGDVEADTLLDRVLDGLLDDVLDVVADKVPDQGDADALLELETESVGALVELGTDVREAVLDALTVATLLDEGVAVDVADAVADEVAVADAAKTVMLAVLDAAFA
jgi:hypothetical protein